MEKLYLVMPAYNEEKNIEDVENTWYPIWERKEDGSKLVIADSGSTDGTHKILVRLQQKYDKLEILSNTQKQHGSKLIAFYALKSGADYMDIQEGHGRVG